VPVGSGRERFVLGTLLLNADRPVPAEALIGTLWAEPPVSARAQLHNMMSNLRRRLSGGDALIASRPFGYELRLGAHRLDLLEFRRLAAGGRQAADDGERAGAWEMLGEALALWRGPALADVPDEFVTGVRQSLHEERLAASESRLDTGLALRRFDDVLGELDPLLADHPYRERLWEIRMLAMVGAGRRADALEAYQAVRRRFVDDLGMEPGPALQGVQRRVLSGEAGTDTVRRSILPRQLPPAAALIGRDKLVSEIYAELSSSDGSAGPVVVLVGPGGVGKTTLALAAAHTAAVSFPDGQLYADLRGSREDRCDPHAVLGRFLRSLGTGGQSPPDDPDERVAMYRSRLAGTRTLVVLDDAADEAQVRPLLPGDPRSAAVVTSRRRLGALVTAARWSVPMLDAADAVELFTRIVGQRRTTEEPNAAAIVALCGHLPLAVCVAAARLAIHPDWTLGEFQSMLAAERQRLDELAVGDLNVRANISLSYHALDPDAQRLLRRLGLVSTEDWPAWVATELLDRPAEGPLDRLVDLHLVEPLGPDVVVQRRFRLHDLVSDFARERALDEEPEPERTEALRRMLEGWLALAAQADERAGHGMIPAAGLPVPPAPRGASMAPVTQTPRQWLEAERASIVGAVEQACRAGLVDAAGQLALRLSGYLALRAHHDDWEHTLRIATERTGDDEIRLRLLSATFAAALYKSRYAALPAIAAEELEVARRLGDPHRAVGALANAGWAARKLGRLAEAAQWLQQALELADDHTPTRLRTRAMHCLANVHREAGRSELAVPLAEQALRIERPQGRVRITAMCLTNYAGLLIDLGRFGEAELALAEALELTCGTSDDLLNTDIELQRAQIEWQQGKHAAARSRLDGWMRMVEGIDDHVRVAEGLVVLAEMAGDAGGAAVHLRRARDIWRRQGGPLELARVLARLERACAAAGDAGAAAQYQKQWQEILAGLELDEACLRLPRSQ